MLKSHTETEFKALKLHGPLRGCGGRKNPVVKYFKYDQNVCRIQSVGAGQKGLYITGVILTGRSSI